MLEKKKIWLNALIRNKMKIRNKEARFGENIYRVSAKRQDYVSRSTNPNLYKQISH